MSLLLILRNRGDGAVSGTGSWEQDQSWAATGSVVNPVAAEAAWVQAAATWSATGIGGVAAPTTGGGGSRLRRLRPIPIVTVMVAGRASWVQEPATWRADMITTRSRQEHDLEELVLIGAV